MAANKAAAAVAVAASTTTTTHTSTVPEAQHQLAITDSGPLSNQPSPDTPTASAVPSRIDKKRSHKKKGRNQHTRDKDGHDEESPARSQSRDIQKDEHTPSYATKTGGEASSKPHSKTKGGMSSKINMTDMKRRVAALLDFISRTQVELAGETLAEARAAAADNLKPTNDGITGGGTSTSTTSDKNLPPDGGHGGASPAAESATSSAATGATTQREFKELNCVEMMDSLTRRLVKWQQEYST